MSQQIETWTYEQIADPQFKWALADRVEELTGKVRLQLADGEIIVGKRVALVNLFFMQILQDFNIPYSKRHFVKRVAFNGDATAEAWNQYYREIVQPNTKNAKRFKMAVWRAMDDLYKFTSWHLLPWTRSLDNIDISEIVNDPAMKEIIDTKWNLKPEFGTDVIEKAIDEGSKKIMKLLDTPGALKNDALLVFQRVRQLNKFQVPQTLFAFGVRTDINDTIIGLPVIGSVVDGIQNIREYGCESLSAKKSQAYGQVAVPGSQYFGRKQHLIASSLEHIYETDCQSTALVDFDVTETNYSNIIGKNIVLNGQYVTITNDNAKEFINTTIHMRSPMTCRYRKGVCSVCAGKVFDNVNRKLNIGILSSIHVIEPTTQKILSAKHLVKTNTIPYQMPDKTNKILVRSTATDIRWRPETYDRLKNIEMGIPLKYFTSIHDVTLIRSDKPIKEERYSQIYDVFIRAIDKELDPVRIVLESNGQVPFLSSEMLTHIRDHYHDLKMDKHIVWIPMAGTEKFALFRNIVLNDNMLQFVDNVSTFLSKEIKNYTSCSEAINAFSRIVHSKVFANITHLEILLKAYMISSPSDYRIPCVDDPNNVLFQTTASILNNRHVGTKLAYQGLFQYVCHPSTYMTLHQESPFDWMIVH